MYLCRIGTPTAAYPQEELNTSLVIIRGRVKMVGGTARVFLAALVLCLAPGARGEESGGFGRRQGMHEPILDEADAAVGGAAAASAAAPPMTKYLLWDLDPPNYGERFSTRKRYAVRAFFLMRQLAKTEAKRRSRARWVMVLPPFPSTFDLSGARS